MFPEHSGSRRSSGSEFQTVQQQKTPDGRRCWADGVARKVGDCWPNADAVGRRRQRLASSGPSGTEVLGCAGIGTSADPACTLLDPERQASEAHCAW